eukprot:TRINITY_DN3714_c0_g1_i1.p1 TRINITY_DN3714_c0_g1~~TRINITY_DN3714_c0_g1_i1.p1  ORF type:complete len:930 (+),score=203.69 TRINITY_DN3714_c0_g1_i1:208-2790(+)
MRKNFIFFFFFLAFVGGSNGQSCGTLAEANEGNLETVFNQYKSCTTILINLRANNPWNSLGYTLAGSGNLNQKLILGVISPQLGITLNLRSIGGFSMTNVNFTTFTYNSALSSTLEINGCQFNRLSITSGKGSTLAITDSYFNLQSGETSALEVRPFVRGDSYSSFDISGCTFVTKGSSILFFSNVTNSITVSSTTFSSDSLQSVQLISSYQNTIEVTDSNFTIAGGSAFGNVGTDCPSCVSNWKFRNCNFQLPDLATVFQSRSTTGTGVQGPILGSVIIQSCQFKGIRNSYFSKIYESIAEFSIESCEFDNSFLLFESKFNYPKFSFVNNTKVLRIDFKNGTAASGISNNPDFICPISQAASSAGAKLDCPSDQFRMNFEKGVTAEMLHNVSLQLVYESFPEYKGFVEWIQWVSPNNTMNKRVEYDLWATNLNPAIFDASFPFPIGYSNIRDNIRKALKDTNWSSKGIQALEFVGPTDESSSSSDIQIPFSNLTNSAVKPTSGLNVGNNSAGLGTGAIVGIVIGGLVILVIIVLVVFFLVKRKNNNGGESSNISMKEAISPPSNIPSQPKFLKNIVIGSQIGKGNFGDVYSATWNGATKVAAKRIRETDDQFLEEAKLLMRLNHPNIVRQIGIWKSEENELYMILEYCKLGSLLSFLNTTEENFSQNDLLLMCQEVAAGMMYLEGEKIIHRDLGARNLLVKYQEGKYIVQVSDFGLSRLTEDYYKSDSVALPYKWSAPEVVGNNQSSTKSDVWSFGICMWEIFTGGMVPYAGQSNKEVVQSTLEDGCTLNRPKNCSDQVWNVMLMCWAMNPKDRPSFSDLYHIISKMTGIDLDQRPVESNFNEGAYNNNQYAFSDDATQ